MTQSPVGTAWLVLPTFNEAENLEPLVEAARAKLPPSSRVLVVDDSSPDGTGEIADRLATRHANVEVLEAVDLDATTTSGYAFRVEVTYRAIRCGFRVVEVPIVFRERRVGKSKMNLSIAAEAVWRLPLLRIGHGAVASTTSGQRRYTL